MKRSTGLLFGALLVPSLALAAPANDPRLIVHEQAVQAYAQAHGMAAPQVRDYQYGMPLDIRNVLFSTGSSRTCDAQPMLMTYTDSSGQLVTLRYSEQGSCPKFQG